MSAASLWLALRTEFIRVRIESDPVCAERPQMDA